MAPIFVSSARGSPVFNAFTFSTKAFLNFSYMERSTKILDPQRQISPWLENEELTEVFTALSKSQSAKIMLGFFPPSSSDNFLNIGAATLDISAPVFVPPVNEITGIPG